MTSLNDRICVCVCVCVCLLVVAYRQFATYGRGWVIKSRPMTNGSQLPTNQLHDINWGARDALYLLHCTLCV